MLAAAHGSTALSVPFGLGPVLVRDSLHLKGIATIRSCGRNRVVPISSRSLLSARVSSDLECPSVFLDPALAWGLAGGPRSLSISLKPGLLG